MALKLMIIVNCLISAFLLSGCRDVMIREGLSKPLYKTSISVNRKGIKFYCEEDYLYFLPTKAELTEKITNLGHGICGENFSITAKKLKPISVNPGEYYARASAKISCTEGYPKDLKIDAKELCRSLFGRSSRSIQAARSK